MAVVYNLWFPWRNSWQFSIALTLNRVFSPFSIFMRPLLFIRLKPFLFYLHFPDIDECESNSLNNCEQLCVNLPASFFCKCRDGYELNADGRNCDGKKFAWKNLHCTALLTVYVSSSLTAALCPIFSLSFLSLEIKRQEKNAIFLSGHYQLWYHF